MRINIDQFAIGSPLRNLCWNLRRKHLFSYWYNRYQWYVYPNLYHVAPFPLHIDIETSSICNMSCPMCYRSCLKKESLGVMGFELFKKIIDECAENNLYSIRLSWRGECLLNPNFIDMVKYAKKKGIKEVSFLTNGLLLDETMSKTLVDVGLDYISVSFDGLGEMYEKIRKPSSFKDAYNRLKKLKEIKKNKKSFKPLVRVCTIWPAIAKNKGKYIGVMQEVVDKIVVNPFIDFRDESPQEGNFICQYLWQRLLIASNGNVVPCTADHLEESGLGNVRDKSIKEIWRGEHLNYIRRKIRQRQRFEFPMCRKCRHGVISEGRYATGNWDPETSKWIE